MKGTRYLLFVIGLLGLAAAGYGLYRGYAFTDQIITLVCSAGLLYGSSRLYKGEDRAG